MLHTHQSLRAGTVYPFEAAEPSNSEPIPVKIESRYTDTTLSNNLLIKFNTINKFTILLQRLLNLYSVCLPDLRRSDVDGRPETSKTHKQNPQILLRHLLSKI
jgi:hypothetical protein